MHPLAFVAILAVVSMAMVFAMVRFSRARLRKTDSGQWLAAYAISWIAIVAVIVMFLRDEPGAVRRNLPILMAFPLGWFVLHAVIVRFAAAIRDAPLPPQRPSVEEVEVEEAPLPPPPSLLQRAIAAITSAIRIAVMLGIALFLIAIGEQIELLHRIDRELSPYRPHLVKTLIAIMAIGFAMFMGGTIRFVLRGGQSAEIPLREIWRNRLFSMIAAGVLLLLASMAGLGIVMAPPGVKLLVMLAVGYVALRFASLP